MANFIDFSLIFHFFSLFFSVLRAIKAFFKKSCPSSTGIGTKAAGAFGMASTYTDFV